MVQRILVLGGGSDDPASLLLWNCPWGPPTLTPSSQDGCGSLHLSLFHWLWQRL